MRFSEWLKQKEMKETTTSTGDVAVFARPIGIGSPKMYPDQILDDEKKHVKKHKKNM